MKNGNWKINRSPSTRAEYHRKWYQKIRFDTIKMLGDRCVKCGYNTDWRALQIDHINGDSEKDSIKTGTSYYYNIQKNIKKGDKGYQILCANCNVIKRAENQESPLKNRDGPNPDGI